jgi:probable addiction module antidote protein
MSKNKEKLKRQELRTGDFDEYLIELLEDPKEARAYLNAALEDEDYRVFLLALRDVAEAFGITALASEAELNRENIYRMLSDKGNPKLSSIVALLRAIGVRLKTEIINADLVEEHLVL